LAANGNNLDAETSLIQVRQELSTEELEHAVYLLKQWKPGSCRSEIMSLAKEVRALP
jgi:hypothetical protein